MRFLQVAVYSLLIWVVCCYHAEAQRRHRLIEHLQQLMLLKEAPAVGEKSFLQWGWEIGVRPAEDSLSAQNPFVLYIRPPLPEEKAVDVHAGGIGGGAGLAGEAEELFADTAWLAHDYARIRYNRTLNPYRQDWKSFDDTVHVALHDSLKSLGWATPLRQGMVTSDFGMRHHRWHYGVDFRLKRGDSVSAAFYGVVRLAQYQRRGFGHYVVVYHYNGLETIYAHLSKKLVKPGDVVRAGDIVGLGGNTGRSTGPHLHFEVRYRGMPINPHEIFDFDKGCPRAKTCVLTSANFRYLKEATSVRTHRVRRGETLSHISSYYGVSISRLCRLNRIRKRAIIRVGQRIRVR